jgi:hypothetical protein
MLGFIREIYDLDISHHLCDASSSSYINSRDLDPSKALLFESMTSRYLL